MKKRLICSMVFIAMATAFANTETETILLSGRGKDDAVPWEFFCTAGQNSGKWTAIPVPSCWEVQGFGAYGYQNDPLKESGKYKTTFSVPASWKDRAIRIVFEGAMTDADVFVNGESAGPRHHGAFYPFKHDISSLVKFSETNLLEVTVAKYSEIESVNAAERRGDYWNFGGIFRPVYLEAVPREHIKRVAIDAKADGSFATHVFSDARTADRVTARIEGLGEAFGAPLKAGEGKVELKAKFSGQKNWTAETPDLYRVIVTLESKGRPLHRIEQRFGFRTVEVRDGDGIYVNGQRVILKGSCRHSFWPDSGRTLSEQISRDDVMLMKQMNMNAVRMSHYPPDRHFLDTCDELGLYVLDEIAGWQNKYDSQVGKRIVEETVTRDVNHPSVIFWDNGNEGGFNFDLDGEYAKWDPQQRRVLHPWSLHDGVDTAHYRPFDEVKTKCAGTNIYLPTEFLHGLYDGGAGVGLDDYWNELSRGKAGAGGFIWAFVDEAVVRTDQKGKLDSFGNRGPDGIVGPRREKEASFFTVKEIWCPVQIAMDELPENFGGTLPVENRFDFTSLNTCQFSWSLVKFPSPFEKKVGNTIVAQGSERGPDIAPHSRGTLAIDLPGNWREADALHLTAEDSSGRELWTWSWPVKSCAAINARFAKPSAGRTEISDEAGTMRIRSGDSEFAIDKRSGMLASVSTGGRRIEFGNGPRFFATATKFKETKDEKSKKTRRIAVPDDLSGTSALASLASRKDGDAAIIAATFSGAMRSVTWTVLPGGWLKCAWEFQFDGSCDIAGVDFDFPQSKMRSIRWLGHGPHRVWKNRLKGTALDVWSNDWNDNEPGESWIYPEFKGYFGPWNWAEFTTSDGRILIANENDATFLGVFRPRDAKEPMDTRLSVPQTGIAILHAIPPAGCKFMRAEKMGPQSQPDKLSGMHSGSVLLHFQ